MGSCTGKKKKMDQQQEEVQVEQSKPKRYIIQSSFEENKKKQQAITVMSKQNEILVIDNGSAITKSGYALNDQPTYCYPTIMGRRRNTSSVENIQTYYGKEAFEMRGTSDIEFLVQNGNITNFEEMRNYWKYLLTIDQADQSKILISEPIYHSKEKKTQLIEYFFETFQIPALCLVPRASLSVMGAGLQTAFLVESGEGITQAVPVFELSPIRYLVTANEFAGGSVTQKLSDLLELQTKLTTTKHVKFIAQTIKEAHCEVALNRQSVQASQLNYRLPDGNSVDISNSRWDAPEVLFGEQGSSAIAYQSFYYCDGELKKTFSENIILSGGTTMMKGYKERFEQDINQYLPSSLVAKIMAPKDGMNLIWRGGQIFSYSSGFDCFWIKRSEYSEQGANIFMKKVL